MSWIGYDLIKDALNELSDADYQRRLWTASSGPEVSSLTEAISRLYDDSALTLALESGDEVYSAHIDEMLLKLRGLLLKVDDRRPPEDVLADPRLARARDYAASVLREIDALDSPDSAGATPG